MRLKTFERCPVCLFVFYGGPSEGYRVPRHRDSLGRTCLASGKDYQIVEVASE